MARDTAMRAIFIRGSTHHTFSSQNRGGAQSLNYIPRRHDSKRPACRVVERNDTVSPCHGGLLENVMQNMRACISYILAALPEMPSIACSRFRCASLSTTLASALSREGDGVIYAAPPLCPKATSLQWVDTANTGVRPRFLTTTAEEADKLHLVATRW